MRPLRPQTGTIAPSPTTGHRRYAYCGCYRQRRLHRWACLPYFDSPAVFGRLLNRRTGGYCAIRVVDGAKASRKYIEGTNILETTFTTRSGTVAVTDFMPVEARQAVSNKAPSKTNRSEYGDYSTASRYGRMTFWTRLVWANLVGAALFGFRGRSR